ncbi:uncharacterized protein LY79DRAFT_9366 [Colletotrichum navitas]|uniref:Uncharacterized protein n=1 Tax=Colletotrichum navitas TaxID=681940 RepID=A0AAD8VCK6_9PEZI|nr:uncharacterized protein LY79DRAFT_9366 [Colletotrichum navitas]KAK1600156.1 hypothetical protein LY79DRAFT_9366 [Colletotrichum navitas]
MRIPPQPVLHPRLFLSHSLTHLQCISILILILILVPSPSHSQLILIDHSSILRPGACNPCGCQQEIRHLSRLPSSYIKVCSPKVKFRERRANRGGGQSVETCEHPIERMRQFARDREIVCFYVHVRSKREREREREPSSPGNAEAQAKTSADRHFSPLAISGYSQAGMSAGVWFGSRICCYRVRPKQTNNQTLTR